MMESQNSRAAPGSASLTVGVDRGDSGPFLLAERGAMMSGYEAANASPARGYVWYPQLNGRKALDQLSDREIRRRILWLWKNFPFTRRLCMGAAKLIGIQTPQPVTSDDDWNELVFDDFVANAGSPGYYDRRGRYDYFTAQPIKNTLRFRDGRLLQVFTETPTGGAQVAYYEAEQLRNPLNDRRPWEFGILTDDADRHLAYSVQDGKDPSKFHEIPARDAVYCGNFDDFSSLTGESLLIPMVCDMIDIVELRGLRKHGAKNVADLGLVIEKDRAVKVGGGGVAGLNGPLFMEEVTLPDGQRQKVSWEMVTAQGVVPRLDDGEKLRVVADDRPTPNNQAFEQALMETIILGTDLPPSALYFIGRGMPGPAIRFNMEDIRRWIACRHRLGAYENRRYYALYVAKRIRQWRESGGAIGLPPHPKGEKWWHKVDMIGQPDMTIDHGREAMSTVIRLESGLTTFTNEYALQGLHAKRELREKIREVAWIKSHIADAEVEFGVELTLGECFPRMAGVAAKDDVIPVEQDEPVPAEGEAEP